MKSFVLTVPLLAALVSGGPIHQPRSFLFSRQTTNFQTFTGNVGAEPVPISDSGDPNNPFEANGATFGTFTAAAQRACDVQNNQCADAANSGAADVSVEQCQAQQDECSQQIQNQPENQLRGLPVEGETTDEPPAEAVATETAAVAATGTGAAGSVATDDAAMDDQDGDVAPPAATTTAVAGDDGGQDGDAQNDDGQNEDGQNDGQQEDGGSGITNVLSNLLGIGG